MKSKNNVNILLFLIVFAVVFLAFASYETGYKKSKNDLGSLLMTMSIDSSFVTAGLYEELPNHDRKMVQFYVEDTRTDIKDVKLFAEVKYITIGDEVISVDNGTIWKYLNKEKVYQRKFEEKGKEENSKNKKAKVPNSTLANQIKK
ncbi:MAG: hypothetical protein KDC52_02745 [Ignavibacteriae bacterium]|nr:hypothetical protein [Ignavibacteriota bacterium]